ncbi:MAG: DUF4342 domain-containing protein [Eubacteriales bacterium]|nr:DUF4342 domain-containing protein [Eubacteriales bacterium]
MTHYEMVELLREKANVTYEEAKRALEASDWDLLDAIVLLEREGKTTRASSSHSTQTPPEQPDEEQPQPSPFRENMKKLAGWAAHLLRVGNRNSFVACKGEKVTLELSVTAAVLLLCVSWPLTLILLLVGLFTGYRYSFRGPQLGKESVNSVLNKVNDAAESVKAEFSAEREEKGE